MSHMDKNSNKTILLINQVNQTLCHGWVTQIHPNDINTYERESHLGQEHCHCHIISRVVGLTNTKLPFSPQCETFRESSCGTLGKLSKISKMFRDPAPITKGGGLS